MTELTLLMRLQFSLWLNCFVAYTKCIATLWRHLIYYEMLSCYYVVVIYIQKPIARHSVVLLPYLSEERFIMGIQYIHVEYG